MSKIAGLILLLSLWRCYNVQGLQSFDAITGLDIAEDVNLGKDSATVLCYEVQYRYWMKPSVKMLSVDGITDGKVGNLGAIEFIRKHRPDYYIPIHPVVKSGVVDTLMLLEEKEIEGIRFVRRGNFYAVEDHRIPKPEEGNKQ